MDSKLGIYKRNNQHVKSHMNQIQRASQSGRKSRKKNNKFFVNNLPRSCKFSKKETDNTFLLSTPSVNRPSN